MPDSLVLIGFSGTGKSSVGPLLAEALGWPFVDTDTRLVEQFGRPIAEIFRVEGEPSFRAAERALVLELGRSRRLVLTLGGGATVDPLTRRTVREGNWVVRLEASPEIIVERLRSSAATEERPLLDGDNPLERTRSLLVARRDAYAEVDLVIDTEGRSPPEVASEILRRLPDSFKKRA